MGVLDDRVGVVPFEAGVGDISTDVLETLVTASDVVEMAIAVAEGVVVASVDVTCACEVATDAILVEERIDETTLGWIAGA